MIPYLLKSPAAFLAIALMLGMGISATLPFPTSLWGYSLALAGLCVLVLVFLRPRRPSLSWCTLVLLIVSLGGFRYQEDTKPPRVSLGFLLVQLACGATSPATRIPRPDIFAFVFPLIRLPGSASGSCSGEVPPRFRTATGLRSKGSFALPRGKGIRRVRLQGLS